MFPLPSVGEGLAPPAMSRKCQWFAVGAGLLTRPPSVDCDARRARRLGAPPYRVSPCGASFFPSDGKETKGSPGETHIAVGNKFPSASSSFSPGPPEFTGAQFRGAAAVAVAPKSRRPGQLDQTGAPDCSRSNLCGRRIGGRVWDPPLRGNFCHTRYDGRRSHRTTSVAPYSMKGPEIAVRAGPGPPAVRGL